MKYKYLWNESKSLIAGCILDMEKSLISSVFEIEIRRKNQTGYALNLIQPVYYLIGSIYSSFFFISYMFLIQ